MAKVRRNHGLEHRPPEWRCSDSTGGRQSALRWWRRNGRDRVYPDPLPRLTHPVSVEDVLSVRENHLALHGGAGRCCVGGRLLQVGRRLLIDDRGRRIVVGVWIGQRGAEGQTANE